jgi:hypothetical protein
MYEASVVAGRVTDAAALLARTAGAPLWRLSEDELEATVEAVFAAESALAAARAVVLAAADERSLRSRTQAPTMQRWLTQRMLVSRTRAEAGDAGSRHRDGGAGAARGARDRPVHPGAGHGDRHGARRPAAGDPRMCTTARSPCCSTSARHWTRRRWPGPAGTSATRTQRLRT